MTRKSLIDPATLSELKQVLESKLNALTDNRENHNRSIGQKIPIDSEEASSLIEEIEISQTENRMESEQIKQIVSALNRIQDLTYGSCESCNAFIGNDRLVAMPSAQFCIQCQAKKETK